MAPRLGSRAQSDTVASPQDSSEWLGALRCERRCFVLTSPSLMRPRLRRFKDAVPMTLSCGIFNQERGRACV